MSKIDDGGPAFPVVDEDGLASRGMTLRDYIATQAAPAFVKAAIRGALELEGNETNGEAIARNAYMLADAMLAARGAA